MTVTTEQIRNIQAGLGAQEPQWDRSENGVAPAAGASGVAITATNGVPTTATQGSPVTVGTGASGVYSALALKAVSLTTASVRFWGYYDGAASGIGGVTGWYLLAGSEQVITTSWTQLVPTGPVSRVYCEVTAITGTSVTPYFGPCAVGSV
jgi:hypothetical protein